MEGQTRCDVYATERRPHIDGALTRDSVWTNLESIMLNKISQTQKADEVQLPLRARPGGGKSVDRSRHGTEDAVLGGRTEGFCSGGC